MEIINIVVYVLAAVISLIGLVLVVLNLPGIWLIYFSAIIVGIIDKFQNITLLILIVIFGLCVISTFTDNIAMVLGAKKLGGTKWGMLGAILGGIVGAFVGGIAGIFLGPLIGATLFEIIFSHKDFRHSIKAGVGTTIGIVLNLIFRFGLSVAMIVFIISRIV
jgi:uncharacterized protein